MVSNTKIFMACLRLKLNKHINLALHRAPEGKKVRLKYKGPIDQTVQSILGGMRSACSYVGAKKLKDLPKSTTFIRVTQTTNEIYTGFENL